MPLDNVRPITNQYNTIVQKEIQNRIAPYDLTQDENTDVWKAIQERDDLIEKEKADLKENKQERIKQEAEKIRANQNPIPQLNMRNNNLPTSQQVLNVAKQVVRANSRQLIRQYQEQADKRIGDILSNAKDQGRGPNNGQSQQNDRSLTQDFNRSAR